MELGELERAAVSFSLAVRRELIVPGSEHRTDILQKGGIDGDIVCRILQIWCSSAYAGTGDPVPPAAGIDIRVA